jgi:hypothetical protein
MTSCNNQAALVSMSQHALHALLAVDLILPHLRPLLAAVQLVPHVMSVMDDAA